MTDELQLLKEDLEKERNNIRNYMYHPSFAGHSKREMTAVYEALGKIISRIDSMKEPIDNDLDEEIVNWCNHGDFGFDYMDIRDTVHHFANWQKQQLMEDALDCSIIMHPNDRFANYSISAYVPPLHPASTYISKGDKVKIIIIREEEK